MKPFPGIKVNFNTSHYWLVLKRQYIATLLGVLLLVVTALVAIVGYYTYGSLSEIVSRLETDEQPNQNLLLYKEILINLQGMESSVEAYQLSQTQRHLHLYDVYVANVSDYLDSLNRSNARDKEIRKLNDSLTSLINRKTDLLLQIIQLDVYASDASLESLHEVFVTRDSVALEPDTLSTTTIEEPGETAEKKGFLKRLFQKKEELPAVDLKPDIAAPDPDSLLQAQREQIRTHLQEKIQSLQTSRRGQLEQKRLQKMQLEEAHFLVQTQILELVAYLESRETVKLQIRSLNARELAARTNEQMVIFFGLAIALLTLSIGMMVVYVRKSRSYQQLLRQSQAATEALAKAKERFFANMSHELRTPLNAITGFTRLLLRSPMSPEQHEQLTMVHLSGEHLLRVVNDLLDFSKLQAEKLQLQKEPFQLDNVCLDCVKLLHESALQKGLYLHHQIELPPVWVLGDSFRLKQVLLNLLSNAIKYTEKGGVELRVAGAPQDALLNVHLVVQDSGIGISAKDQERLFQEFEQADQSSFTKGTGLGLAITKKLVQLHKGQIVLESEPGQGTTVRLSLSWPITEAPELTDAPAIAPQPLTGLHALIADDEPFNVKLLSALLKTWGVAFTSCTDGREALKLAMDRPFDVLLLDLKMPGMNGWEVIGAVRESEGPNQATPALALTATADHELSEQMKTGQFQQLLTKPLEEKDLYEALSRISSTAKSYDSVALEPTDVNLTSLTKTGDMDFVKDMIATFAEGATTAVMEMKAALEQGDFEQISLLAHRTVAPARHFKATQLVSLLKDLEQRADVQDATLSITELNTLERIVQDTIQALNHALQLHSS